MNYLDLFSGIGGFAKGLQESGFTFKHHLFSEIDKYAKQIYKKHFPESEDLGDVRTITVDGLPKQINLVTFGFPCQDLSIAGKRAGLTGQRSGLFSEAIRIIRDARPDYFIFENVKGLFSSNGGRDWLTVLREIAGIGYDGQWQLLNTRWILPQNREQIYFVGHIRGRGRPKIFPIGERNNDAIKKHIGVCGKYTNTLVKSYGKISGCSTKININNKLRINTPIECERLQGFEDGWTEGISDTQRYKCLGNAVTVPIVKLIADKLINYVNL